MSHSKLAPSGAKTWTSCTASVALIEELKAAGKIPEGQSSIYAEEGTLAHQYASDIQEGKASIDDIEDPEMAEAVQDYLDFCNRITNEGDIVFIEEKVPLFYRPEDGGTVDYAAVNADKVYIADLKYGKGVMVDAKDNPQLAIYALSLVEEYEMIHEFHDDTLITMAIYQPRTRDDSPVKIWAIKLSDLREQMLYITEAAKTIEEGFDTVMAPSEDACQWCDAKGLCTARKARMSEEFDKEGITALDDLTELDEIGESIITTDGSMPPVDALTDAQIVAVIKHHKPVIKWMEDVVKDAKKRAEAGDTLGGEVKMVEGALGKRQWADEEQALTLIRGKLKADQYYVKKLVTLPQAEKLLKGVELSSKFKNRFEALTQRKPGAPVMVLASDKRPAIGDGVEELEIIEDSSDDMLD